MALNIKNIETERLANELADATGETLTEAVRRAVLERLEHVRRQRGSRARLRSGIAQIQRTVAALPMLDHRSADEILYDEHGLPR